MGTFFHTLRLVGPTGVSEQVEALVDTGVAFTTVPASLLQRLGVQAHRTVRLRLANGQVVNWPIGRVFAEIDGTREIILCVFGAEEAPPVMGAHTLEAFLLTVDPIEQCLVPKEALLM